MKTVHVEIKGDTRKLTAALGRLHQTFAEIAATAERREAWLTKRLIEFAGHRCQVVTTQTGETRVVAR